jgi:glutamyl-tRNA synthetase
VLAWAEQLAECGSLVAETEVGDVVLRRADGFLAYHLATAVDELALGITDVVRGNDLLSATAPQVAVMRELDGVRPRYWHLPLWRDDQGQRLSKRDGGFGLDSLQLVPAGSRLSSAELLQHCSLESLQAVLARPAEGLRKASGSIG